MSETRPAVLALTMSTLAFTFCFACWVVNAVLVTFLVSNEVYAFSGTQVGWLLAVPILSGALSRVPLGLLTDQYGGRGVFTLLMLIIAVPMYLLSMADSFFQFLLASLGFGLAGGSFAVGVGYVSSWFEKSRQGTALGVFGAGNAGAALTTIVAPQLLNFLTQSNLDAWRTLPRIYALLLVVMAVVFFFSTQPRRVAGKARTLKQQLAPLGNVIVWRFGLYYFLVFGSFVSLAQWLVPYSVNVYGLSVAQAGLLAALFSLPSGVIRAAGGWMSDHFGPRTVMYWVFYSCILSCVFLAIPRMDINSPGAGVTARADSLVSAVSPLEIATDEHNYELIAPPTSTPGQSDDGSQFMPVTTRWQIPVVEAGDAVVKKQLLARGVTNIYYPANLWLFAFAVLVFGVATGIGKAGVYRFIPDQFPDQVGVVGGMVGLLGAMGGFFFPLAFGYMLRWTGIWASCWIILAVISLGCLIWMHMVIRRIMAEEVPDLAQVMERRPTEKLDHNIKLSEGKVGSSIEDLLRQIPYFADLSPEEIKGLTAIGSHETIAARHAVFKMGDAGETLYVILSGEVSIIGRDDDNNEIELARLGEGNFFGELALIDHETRSADARANTDCEFFLIQRNDFLRLLSSAPRVLADLLVGLSAKIRGNNQKVFDLLLRKERLRSEQEIDRHRSIGEMVAGVAHEINTPLGIVNHAASIIDESLRPETVPELARDEEARETLGDVCDASQLIQSNIARASKLIQSFKHLSISHVTDHQEQVDIVEQTREVVELYRLQAQSCGLEIEIENELRTGQEQWLSYPGCYSQVLLNLLTNIARYAYSSSGGKAVIRISSREFRNQAGYQVEVRDFGAGISAEEQARVFEPFFTTGRDKGGSGLGLAIVRNLVNGPLGGEIKLQSSEGEGCAIYLEFPQISNAAVN